MIMKKILFSLLALLSVNLAWADEVTVPDVEIMPGQTSYVEIYLSVDSKTIYGGFQLDATLPEKLTCAEVTYEELGPNGDLVEAVGPDGELGKELQEANFQFSRRFVNGDSQHMRYVSFALGAVINRDNVDNMMLMRIPVTADASVSIGDKLQGKISEIILQSPAGSVKFDDITFTVTVTDCINLYDTATEIPEAKEDVNVVVNRTIKGGDWSTICLPFAMDANQIAEAFGSDAKIADFTGIETVYSEIDDEYAESIDLQFSTASTIEANHPYLIYVTSDIEKFRVDGVTIEPDDEPVVTVGGRRTPSDFIGTYTVSTVPAENVFLSGNKFYYSVGSTAIKGFRGYFDLFDLLYSYTTDSEVKINMSVDGTTAISNIDMTKSNNEIFGVNGIKMGNDMNRLNKGIYIVNGKKIVK